MKNPTVVSDFTFKNNKAHYHKRVQHMNQHQFLLSVKARGPLVHSCSIIIYLLSSLQIQTLQSLEEEQKKKISELQKQPSAELLARIALLERSEKGLKRKIEILESDHLQAEEEATLSFSMLDSPEDILKQRIRDLEKMDRHLKQQVSATNLYAWNICDVNVHLYSAKLFHFYALYI